MINKIKKHSQLIIAISIFVIGIIFILDFDVIDCIYHNGFDLIFPDNPEYCGYGGINPGINQIIGMMLLIFGGFLIIININVKKRKV